ncbi:MAG: DNA-deoxyinosine glycosylase [Woeseiaceae bacterium]|nr:DNA-deoxyinosine glycosylase [Woeseiaceae bacterium]
MERSEGFPPVARSDARLLVLGSLPGERSIREQQYYAHPQNAFWRIMRDVYGVEGAYEDRCDGLVANRLALWDVLKRSVRPGSMDADIDLETAEENDFDTFFAAHPSISKVLCNGQTAGRLFLKRVLPSLDCELVVDILPSTSPAYASMRYDRKLETWRAALGA